MHPGKRDFFLTALKLGDLLAMLIALAISVWLKDFSPLQIDSFWEVLQVRFKATNVILLLIFIPLWHLIFLSVGLYDARRFEQGQSDVKDIVKAVTHRQYAADWPSPCSSNAATSTKTSILIFAACRQPAHVDRTDTGTGDLPLDAPAPP